MGVAGLGAGVGVATAGMVSGEVCGQLIMICLSVSPTTYLFTGFCVSICMCVYQSSVICQSVGLSVDCLVSVLPEQSSLTVVHPKSNRGP